MYNIGSNVNKIPLKQHLTRGLLAKIIVPYATYQGSNLFSPDYAENNSGARFIAGFILSSSTIVGVVVTAKIGRALATRIASTARSLLTAHAIAR